MAIHSSVKPTDLFFEPVSGSTGAGKVKPRMSLILCKATKILLRKLTDPVGASWAQHILF